jgi:hypothetical protein
MIAPIEQHRPEVAVQRSRFGVQSLEVFGSVEVANCDIQSGDEVRAKLAGLNLKGDDVADAVAWARKSHEPSS